MHLVSQSSQRITVAGESFAFAEGATICTEYSHKYTIDGFAGVAAELGLELRQRWTDEQECFAVVVSE
jgi:uncharacterized SAM-dependent methyltransferase